ncbi:MAG: ATP-binding cassette domain-containing protein [Desulfobacterales bacterium]
MSNEIDKVIYSMINVSKFYDNKPVLKDISLSYFYGAKIGVIGLNGSGKSSLLRILAGVDQEFNGRTILSDGDTIGYLEQEPLVDVDKTVREVVEEGVQETSDLLKAFEEINMKFAEPMIDGFLTESPPIYWPSKGAAGWSSLRATGPSMKPTVKSAWVRMLPVRIASSIDGCPDRREFEKKCLAIKLPLYV